MTSCSRQLFGTPREWAVRITVGVAGGVFFGLIGPFGSYADALPIRLACWTVAFCLGVTLFSVTVRAARLFAPRLELPLWFATGAGVAVACAPFSIAIGLIFNASYWRKGGWSTALEFYGDSLLVGAPLTLIYVTVLDRVRTAGEPVQPGAPADIAAAPPLLVDHKPTSAALLDRLPPRLGRELIALQMEDHYVRAHTPLGSDLLLMPIGQAVEALTEVDGLRVHRSWWVARSAVKGVAWHGRNLRLVLSGGLEAPVSRAQVASLRTAGWIGAEETADP